MPLLGVFPPLHTQAVGTRVTCFTFKEPLFTCTGVWPYFHHILCVSKHSTRFRGSTIFSHCIIQSPDITAIEMQTHTHTLMLHNWQLVGGGGLLIIVVLLYSYLAEHIHGFEPILIFLSCSLSPPTLSSHRFNYRATHHLTSNGFYEFLNWFDERAWYPLGRIVGGTVSGDPWCVCVCVCVCSWLLSGQIQTCVCVFRWSWMLT